MSSPQTRVHSKPTNLPAVSRVLSESEGVTNASFPLLCTECKASCLAPSKLREMYDVQDRPENLTAVNTRPRDVEPLQHTTLRLQTHGPTPSAKLSPAASITPRLLNPHIHHPPRPAVTRRITGVCDDCNGYQRRMSGYEARREYEELRICRHRGSSRKRRRGHTNQQRRIRFAIFGAPS